MYDLKEYPIVKTKIINAVIQLIIKKETIVKTEPMTIGKVLSFFFGNSIVKALDVELSKRLISKTP